MANMSPETQRKCRLIPFFDVGLGRVFFVPPLALGVLLGDVLPEVDWP